MKIKKLLKVVSLVITCVFTISFLGCQQDINVLEEIVDARSETQGRAIYSSREVSFSHGNGTYSSSMADSDFGNIGGWDASAYISSETCRITLAPDVIGTAGGMESRIDISDGDEYTLEFRIRFHSEFDWSRGGKCGWGFQMGNGVTGCRSDDARNNQGGSMRLMWYTNDDGRTYFQPYIYHRGMTTRCGDTFGKSYPSGSGSLQRGSWYDVKMYYKANTGSNYNGIARLWINGTEVLNQTNIRWADNSNRTVRGLYYSVFRGGSESYWGSPSVGYIYFDNLKWQKDGSSSNPNPTNPTVSFSDPSNNETFTAGDDVYVEVDASHSSGISNVQLYLNGSLVRQENNPPYTWGADITLDPVLFNMSSGTYTLQAVATSSDNTTSSTTRTFTVASGGGNTLPRIEAESYYNMSDVQTQTCSEGGLNVGWIDDNDWMAFSVNVPSSGNYTVSYRVASPNSGGSLQLESYGGGTSYGTVNIPNTGGWQNWTTVSHSVYLNAGTQNLAIKAGTGGWNLNWWGN